jgi:hypothetical protein
MKQRSSDISPRLKPGRLQVEPDAMMPQDESHSSLTVYFTVCLCVKGHSSPCLKAGAFWPQKVMPQTTITAAAMRNTHGEPVAVAVMAANPRKACFMERPCSNFRFTHDARQSSIHAASHP